MVRRSTVSQRLILPFLITFLAVSAIAGFNLLSRHKTNQDELIDDLRSRIKEELRMEMASDIERLVKEEVQRVYETDLAQKRASAEFSLSRSSDTARPFQEELDEAIRRIVREVYEEQTRLRTASAVNATVVSDEMLDKFVAGAGIEPDTTIKDGIVKRAGNGPAFQLAQAGTSRASDQSLESEVDQSKLEKNRPESIERTMQQKGSVLLPKGQLVAEPSFTYAHFSTNRINIQGVTILEVFTIGPISTEKIQRDMFIQTTSLKYGLRDNLQGELRIPFRYEFDRISSTDGTSESTRSKGGLGDIDFSLSRQIGWESGWKPDLIASLGVKTNSGEPIYNNDIALGSGHWSVRSTLIATKSSDPAVVFGSLSYIHNFERSFDNFGKIQPGGTFAYSLGLAIALSYQTAINFSFDQSITQKLKRGGTKVVGSFVNSANFKTGLNWAINERSSVDLSVAVGLTDDSPDLTVEIRFPYRF
jgi:hypothetical protein